MKIVLHEAAMLTGKYELRIAEIKRQNQLRCSQIVQSILGAPNGDPVPLWTTTLALFWKIGWVYTWHKGFADWMTQVFLHGRDHSDSPAVNRR